MASARSFTRSNWCRPELLKRLRPFVQGPYRLGIRPIHHVPSVSPHPHQPHVAQHLQVLRDRGLLQPQRDYDVAHRPLCIRQVNQDLPPPRLGHRIERIRSRSRSCHVGEYIFLYGNMSSAKFCPRKTSQIPHRRSHPKTNFSRDLNQRSAMGYNLYTIVGTAPISSHGTAYDLANQDHPPVADNGLEFRVARAVVAQRLAADCCHPARVRIRHQSYYCNCVLD